MEGKMEGKKKYIKPIIETEEALERVTLACTLQAGKCHPANLQTS